MHKLKQTAIPYGGIGVYAEAVTGKKIPASELAEYTKNELMAVTKSMLEKAGATKYVPFTDVARFMEDTVPTVFGTEGLNRPKPIYSALAPLADD